MRSACRGVGTEKEWCLSWCFRRWTADGSCTRTACTVQHLVVHCAMVSLALRWHDGHTPAGFVVVLQHLVLLLQIVNRPAPQKSWPARPLRDHTGSSPCVFQHYINPCLGNVSTLEGPLGQVRSALRSKQHEKLQSLRFALPIMATETRYRKSADPLQQVYTL